MLPLAVLFLQPMIVFSVTLTEYDENGIQKSPEIITGIKSIPCGTMKKCTGDLFLDQKDVDVDARRRQKILSKAKRLYDIRIRTILRHISKRKNSGYKNATLQEGPIKSFHLNKKDESNRVLAKTNSIRHSLNEIEKETSAITDSKDDFERTVLKTNQNHHRRNHKSKKGRKKHHQGVVTKKCCLIGHKQKAHSKKIKKNTLWDRRIPRI